MNAGHLVRTGYAIGKARAGHVGEMPVRPYQALTSWIETGDILSIGAGIVAVAQQLFAWLLLLLLLPRLRESFAQAVFILR